MKPLARSEDLVVQKLPEEIVVYDLKTHQARCLNKAVARVWELSDGSRSVEQLAETIEDEFNVPRSSSLVQIALEDLSNAGLLAQEFKHHAPAAIDRRTVLKNFATFATFFLVAAITVPTAGEAASADPSPTPTMSSFE